MNLDELRSQVDAEFEQIDLVLFELKQLETVLNRSPNTAVPVLFDEELFHELSGLRRLRHFIAHGYSFSLNREILFESAVRIDPLISGFKATVPGRIGSDGTYQWWIS